MINSNENWITDARRRLAAKRGKKPATKAAQIWALWSEIETAIAEGQRIDTICRWLQEEVRIHVAPNTLTSYIARWRKKEKLGRIRPDAHIRAEKRSGHDPMAVARRALDKSRFDIR